MEKIFYQTNVYTAQNILYGIFIGFIHLLFVYVISDPYFDLETNYQGMLLVLIMFWMFMLQSFKKFTLTEDEFIVAYLPISFILKPKKTPLNDIEKLVFKEGKNRTSSPEIQIYRASKGWKSFYGFSLDTDDIQRLINALRSKGVQVECVGYIWK